jgi:hypothetical protein
MVGAARQAVLAAPLAPAERRRLNSEIAGLDFDSLLAGEGLPGVQAAVARLLAAEAGLSFVPSPDGIGGDRP